MTGHKSYHAGYTPTEEDKRIVAILLRMRERAANQAPPPWHVQLRWRIDSRVWKARAWLARKIGGSTCECW